jgi:hypothetical protein
MCGIYILKGNIMKIIGYVFVGIFVVVGLFALGWIGEFSGLLQSQYFSPKHEAVRRDTMIESRAYSEATTREIYRLKLQYQQAATDAEKQTIRAMVIHASQAFDRNRLPPDLQAFIIEIGG